MYQLVVSLAFRAAPLMSFFAAAWVIGQGATRDAPGFGLTRISVADLPSAIAFSAIITSRLVAVLPHWRITVAHPLDLLRVTDGLSFSGGVLGALGGLVIFSWRAHLPILNIADLYGSVLPLGVATHGVGCLLRHDCYGREAPPPFGIVFSGMRTPRYPVELYAVVLALLAYGGTQLMRRKRLPRGGIAFASIAVLACSRVVLDALRLDSSNRLLSIDQRFSLVLTGASGTMLIVLWWRTKQGTSKPILGKQPPTPSILEGR